MGNRGPTTALADACSKDKSTGSIQEAKGLGKEIAAEHEIKAGDEFQVEVRDHTGTAPTPT